MSKAKLIGKASEPMKRKDNLRWQRKNARKRMQEFTVSFGPHSFFPKYEAVATMKDIAVAHRKKGR